MIGPSGIGRVHAREFARAGAPVTAVLASTPESSRRAADDLIAQFGNPVRACESLTELAASETDAVVVCSPPPAHLEAIYLFLEAGKYVLCEKPLFWRDGLTVNEVAGICNDLARKAAGRLVVNTNNTWFPQFWFENFGKPSNPSEYEFHFYTNGPYQSDAIGIDLLPHALSVLLECAPKSHAGTNISNISKTVQGNQFVCTFEFQNIRCRVDLRENPGGARRFWFRLDDMAVERIQRNEKGEYAVYLAPAERTEDAVRVADPFEISIRRFLGGAASGQRFDEEMKTATTVMSMMTQILTNR